MDFNKVNVILEIGCEELPYSALTEAVRQLGDNARTRLTELRLSYAGVWSGGTPRRLVLAVEGLADRQPAADVEVQGPARKAAFGPDGTPLPPAIGFAKGQGVEVRDLQLRQTPKGEYVFALRHDQGEAAADVLRKLLPELIASITFPKTMFWTAIPFRFARPIRWILALYNGVVVPFTVAEVASASATRGHRLTGAQTLTVKNAADYFAQMEQQQVLVDPDRRLKKVRELVEAEAARRQGRALIPQDLLEIVTNMVETPAVLAGTFAADHLTLPKEVLVSEMAEHQRYFPVETAEGRLMPLFINVLDGGRSNSDKVRVGNEDVLEARLRDGRFFFQEDTRTTLQDKAARLEAVVWHEKLGNLAEKGRRMAKLASSIAGDLGGTDAEKAQAAQSAALAKADLVTGMVGEFPKLQGVMGRVYADKDGMDPAVGRAVEEHYLPRFAGDALPGSLPGAASALADKLDLLVGFAGAGIAATGSQDPFGQRRAAAGTIAILMQRNCRSTLGQLVQQTYDLYEGKLAQDLARVREQVLALVRQRFVTVLDERGIRYDIRDAVLAGEVERIDAVLARADALSAWSREDRFPVMVTALSRVINILPKEGRIKAAYDPALGREAEEKSLFAAYQKLFSEYDALFKKNDFGGVLEKLDQTRPVIDAYFNKVRVNCPDPKERDNHLILLQNLKDLFTRVADFSKIVIQ